MADSDSDSAAPAPAPAPAEAVERCAGTGYWTVSRDTWAGRHAAALPEEYASLLAPPIVVGVAAISPDRANLPAAATSVVRSPVTSLTLEAPSFQRDGRVLVPAPPRAPGRHRRRARFE